MYEGDVFDLVLFECVFWFSMSDLIEVLLLFVFGELL